MWRKVQQGSIEASDCARADDKEDERVIEANKIGVLEEHYEQDSNFEPIKLWPLEQ